MKRLLLLMVMSLFLAGAAATVAYALVVNCPLNGTCEGTSDDDTFNTTDTPDKVFGKGGNDFVKPSAKRDQIFAGADNDDLYGGGAGDRITAGNGNDYVVGGNGEDQLNGDAGDDVIVTGEDQLADEVECGPGFDTVYLSQNDHASLASDCEKAGRETFKSFEQVEEDNPGVVGEAGDPADPAPESGDPADAD